MSKVGAAGAILEGKSLKPCDGGLAWNITF